MKDSEKKLIFLILFTLVGFFFLQISFNKLAGSNVSFTLFDFFAPIAGVFLGPALGILSVLTVGLTNNFFHDTWTTGSIIRLFPTLFAVYYFAVFSQKKSSKWILGVPLLSILIFLAHPIGRQVPYYTLFWLIPFLGFKYRNNLYMRSLGATFTAHAVGGAAWIWAFQLPGAVWNSLIPIVISERLLFAAGIAASYLLMKSTVHFLVSRGILPKIDFKTA